MIPVFKKVKISSGMRKSAIPFLFLLSFIVGCDKNDNFVIFSAKEDVALGQQVNQEIQNDPQFNVLLEQRYPQAYTYLNNLVDEILASDDISYKEEFVWDVYIIRNDTMLNAFATPGGYLYVYTGLIKYLDNADALAGVLAHEIAHADLRHTSRNLQKAYGVNLLLGIVLGNDASQLEAIAGQLAGTLAGLSFSRDYEREADFQSVTYLADSKYACNGAALFFDKLQKAGNTNNPPEFLSTHPSPKNRISKINEYAEEINCELTLADDTNYSEFKSLLFQNL